MNWKQQLCSGFSDVKVDPQDISHATTAIENNVNIRTISFESHCLFDERQIENLMIAISKNPRINHINFQWCKLTRNTANLITAFFRLCKNLTTLDIGRTEIDQLDIREIILMLPTSGIQTLVLDFLPLEDRTLNGLIQTIRRGTNLRTISIRGMHFTETTEDLICQLVQCPLENIIIGSNMFTQEKVERILNAIRGNENLHRLDLSTSNMHQINTPIADALLNLKTLTLCDCKISGKYIQWLCDLLSDTRCHLEELDLSRNMIGTEGSNSLAISLSSNCSLVELRLGQCNINSDGVRSIVTSMEKNNKCVIQSLYLNDNRIGDEGIIELARIFRENPAFLRVLDICHCFIRDPGALELIDALKENVYLETLIVEDYGITKRITSKLAEAIGVNRNLRYLRFVTSSLEDTSQLSLALIVNTTLEYLTIRIISYEIEGFMNMLNAAENNSNLKVLNIINDFPSSSILNSIQEIRRNIQHSIEENSNEQAIQSKKRRRFAMLYSQKKLSSQ